MWQPTGAELATAVARRPPGRPSQHVQLAKDRHSAAMRGIVMSRLRMPRGLSVTQQNEYALRDFIRSTPELAATADSISHASLEAVVAQMAEDPSSPVSVTSRDRRHRMRRAPIMREVPRFLDSVRPQSQASIRLRYGNITHTRSRSIPRSIRVGASSCLWLSITASPHLRHANHVSR